MCSSDLPDRAALQQALDGLKLGLKIDGPWSPEGPAGYLPFTVMGEDAGRTVNRYEVCQIAEARMREIFEMIAMELEDVASAMPRAGIILTGGAAQMPGITELGREVLQLPVRVAGPLRVSGLTDTITTPAYSTAIGLLRWGALNVVGDEAARYDTMPGGSVVGRDRKSTRLNSSH